LDAIWQSQTAWDIVKAKSMAVGKFAAGRAGLNGADYADFDAVASSQTAMDAVSASSLAVQSVTGSALALWRCFRRTLVRLKQRLLRGGRDAEHVSDELS